MANQNQNNAFSTLDELMKSIKSQNKNKIKNSKTLLIINKIKKIKKDELKVENSKLLFLLCNIPSKYLKIILDTFNKLKFELDDEGFQNWLIIMKMKYMEIKMINQTDIQQIKSLILKMLWKNFAISMKMKK